MTGENRLPSPSGQFDNSLSSLVLFITLFVILGGVFMMAPGLGVVIAIFAVPALVRTCRASLRRSASGDPMSAGAKVSMFLLTAAMIVGAIVAVPAAFFFTCLATYSVGEGAGMRGGINNEALVGSALALGSLVSLVVAILLGWLVWRGFRPGRGD